MLYVRNIHETEIAGLLRKIPQPANKITPTVWVVYSVPLMRGLKQKFPSLNGSERATAVNDSIIAFDKKICDGRWKVYSSDTDSNICKAVRSYLFKVSFWKARDRLRSAQQKKRKQLSVDQQVQIYQKQYHPGRSIDAATISQSFRSLVYDLEDPYQKVAQVMAAALPDAVTSEQIATEINNNLTENEAPVSAGQVRNYRNHIRDLFRSILHDLERPLQ